MSRRESLAARSALFAQEVQALLRAVLPGDHRVVAVEAPRDGRFLVRPVGSDARARRIPLFVGKEHLGELGFSLYLSIDHARKYLKTVRSDVSLHSVLDRAPLLRLEYRSDMRSAPIAHWQIHAERGSMTHLLTHAHRLGRVGKPHDLSAIHFPVGGERFRPCLEDVLQFLIHECGADHRDGWESAVRRSREQWRLRQLSASVRDAPHEAARTLRELGWSVSEGDGQPTANLPGPTLTTW